jgi:transposase
MLYTAIDYHKKYSVACTMDAAGQRVKEARIANAPAAFATYFRCLPEKSRVVMEASWNWGWLYDLLDDFDEVEEVVLANPAKTRIIADAQIKTDRLDARALCTLLRGELVARAHASSKAVRSRKEVLRQRIFWVRMRTRLRNRIHVVVDRQYGLERPVCADLFGQKGLAWLRQLQLPEPDGLLRQQSLAVHDERAVQIRELEKRLAEENRSNPVVRHLQTLPGVGAILATVIAAEIDRIDRFRGPDKLCAYAGLAPTTHASGGHVHHGRLLTRCNRWLRWALAEAAWVAISSSPYFGSLYQRHRDRGKKANVAITIVARRLCRIAWAMLHENRDYSNVPPTQNLSPAAPPSC